LQLPASVLLDARRSAPPPYSGLTLTPRLREPKTNSTIPPSPTMRSQALLIPAALSALSIVVAQATATGQDLRPPIATLHPKIDTLHGEIRTDNYFWLREKTNPDGVAYLNAETAYTEAQMRHTETLQKKLYDEMLARVKETDVSVPYPEHGYLYWTATE